MKLLKNNLIFSLPVLSGILLILSYPPCNFGFLVFISLIPLFFFLKLKIVSLKKAFWGGFITGIIFFGKLFGWLFATPPFEWLGLSTEKGFVFVLLFLIAIWLIQIVFFGLFFGVFAWIIKKLMKFNLVNFNALILIPGLWIVLEYLRAWGFGILWLGKETLFGPHWTFGNLTYALHNIPPLIQIADITGIYGISFLILLVNVGLFLIWKQCRRLSLTHIAVLMLVLILLGLSWADYGIYKLKSESYEAKPHKVKIALLQTNFISSAEFNSYQKKEIFNTVLGLLQSATDRPDFIIAPEGFGIVSLTGPPGNEAGNTETTKYLLKDFYQSGQIFLENKKIIDDNGKVKSRLFYYDLNKEKPIAFHDKLLLVPNGDFMPYLTKAILNIYSFNLNYQERLTQKGEKNEPVHLPQGIVGGTICSSILSPNIQQGMTKKGAQFLVVVSSDAPFHGAKSLLLQNLAMSKLRAIENRRYFAQATNMGYSFLLDPNGKIVLKPEELGNKILFSDIQMISNKTIYTKFGDWIILLAILLILFSLTFKMMYNNRYRP